MFWWSKGSTKELAYLAEMINSHEKTLLITDQFHLPSILSLTYQLNPEVLLQFTIIPIKNDVWDMFDNICFLSNTYNDEFLEFDKSIKPLPLMLKAKETGLSLYKIK